MSLNKKDFWSGLIMVVIGAALLTILIPTGIDEPKKVKFAVMSPSYYPRIVAILMVLVGLAVAIGGAKRQAEIAVPEVIDFASIGKVAAVFAIFLAAAYALPHAGFVLTCTIALVALMTLAGERNLVIVVLVALLLPACLHLFFTKVANVPIPGGILEPYLQRI